MPLLKGIRVINLSYIKFNKLTFYKKEKAINLKAFYKVKAFNL